MNIIRKHTVVSKISPEHKMHIEPKRTIYKYLSSQIRLYLREKKLKKIGRIEFWYDSFNMWYCVGAVAVKRNK
jgi:hypothetical protein